MTRLTRLLCGMAVCLPMGASARTLAYSVDGKVAVFHLDGPIIEKPQGDLGFSLGFQPVPFKEIIERLEKAEHDEAIRAILFTTGAPELGMAQVEELQRAMQKMSKPVYMHVDSFDTRLYALATGAKHISVTPTGEAWLLGFYVESPYLKGLMDKIHVKPDFVHIGDYKSAGEMLYRTGPSEAAEANVNWLLDGLYGSLVETIARTRFNGDEEKVRKIINGGPYSAEEALELGLIDSVRHRQDLVAELKTKYGGDLKFVHDYGRDRGPEIDFNNPFGIFQFFSELMSGGKKSTATAIAVVYVEGVIIPGADEPGPFGSSGEARSTTIRKALDEAAADDSVKAVVLRVDSPGGSALASEIIYDATQRIRAAGKPVVVSMGNVAASGGYYVSCGADHIFADPMTITASIGVVGGKLVTTEMWDSLGINWHEYQRGEAAALMSSARVWSDEERGRILKWMEDVYATFRKHISEHRGSKLSQPLEEIAGGRVYTGAQAVKLGLVDNLGTLEDAFEKAADLASVGDFERRVLPKPKNLFDWIREGVHGEETERVQVSLGADRSAAGLLGRHGLLTQTVLPMLESLDPQRAEVLVQALRRLELIHKENVLVMTSEDWLIRSR